ncbi:hypothetical protein, partial [Streptomyces sp. ADI96-02]|uniref:hypothetical protein n=1 Tax=Streptomyces sp. ADI96-02 TaxID=1522760 RepID=UPI0013DE6E3E
MRPVASRRTALRSGGALGVIGAMSAAVALSGAGAASASTTVAHNYVELEIVNSSGENLDLDAKTSKEGSRGETVSEARNGVPGLPASTFDSEKGAARTYAVDLVGENQWLVNVGLYSNYKNFFNIQAASKAGTDKSQVSLVHEGSVPETSNNVDLKKDNQNTDAFSFSLEEQSKPSSGFNRKYRLTISKSPTYADSAPSRSMDVKKLTGSSVA